MSGWQSNPAVLWARCPRTRRCVTTCCIYYWYRMGSWKRQSKLDTGSNYAIEAFTLGHNQSTDRSFVDQQHHHQPPRRCSVPEIIVDDQSSPCWLRLICECQLVLSTDWLPATKRGGDGGGGRCNQPVIAGNSEFVHFGINSVCDCTVNYRLWSGCRTATLYSSGPALRRGAANGTLCCPSVAADSLLDTATSTHGGRSVCVDME